MLTLLNKSAVITVVLLLCGVRGFCQSPLDWMSLSEVEQVLERLPEFRHAAKSPGCPGFLVFRDASPRILSLQLRGFCPVEVAGSTTVKNYAFDRATGQLLDWTSREPPLDVPVEVRAMARTLLKSAKARALSEKEARCVALSAASEEAAPGKDNSLAEKGRAHESTFEFQVEQRTSSSKKIIQWTLVVDVSAATVLDGSTGSVLNYATTNDLLSAMRIVREPSELTPLEAVDVATRIPAIAAEFSSECPPKVGSAYGTSSERFITIEDVCKDHPIYGRTIAAVNTGTGLVTDIISKTPLSSKESKSVASELLQQHRDRRAQAQAHIDRVCGSGSKDSHP